MRVTFLFSFAALGGASGYRFNGLPPSSRGGRSSSSRGSRPLNRVISSSAVTLPDLLVGGTPSSTGSTSTRQQREVSRPEQPPAEDGGGRTTSIKARAPPRLEVGRGKNKLPNTWLAVALSSTVKKGKTQKITVNGTPLVIWRDKEGAVHCVSDICIHRGASLASGWVAPSTCVVCPYHGFEFDGEGTLAYMPGVETKRRDSTGVNNASARKTTAYKVTEAGGWVHVFPDAERAGAVEAALEPFAPPEASDPTFRAVEGSMIIDGSVESCMENTLDLLHISYVHSFGNLQHPVPMDASYESGFDDGPDSRALATSAVTFRYMSGPKSMSKLSGTNVVTVRNEAHLPYTAVIRVFFGKNCVKTIHASAVPVAEGRTMVMWRLYRNFAMTVPRDEGPINQALDAAFRVMMHVTLTEDKKIVEELYTDFQQGFMSAKFDKQVLNWRRATDNFHALTEDRERQALVAPSGADSQIAAQVELLHRISKSARGRASTPAERQEILSLIQQLESGEPAQPHAQDIDGEWHLQFIDRPGTEYLATGVHAADIAQLTKPGGEAKLLNWGELGRPLWADTDESVQIVNAKEFTLSNRAAFRGWYGAPTVVQLDAIFKECEEKANRVMVYFQKAMLKVGGLKLSFPIPMIPAAWLETTFVSDSIRIARGNKGSVFVLTRMPLRAKSRLFQEDGE